LRFAHIMPVENREGFDVAGVYVFALGREQTAAIGQNAAHTSEELCQNEPQERKVFEVTKSLGGAPAAIDHITAHLCSKVRVFLTELAEGVSNYRSMHNLTEQVEHQYHGRFLIELIQNAHDALGGGSSGRIHIRFEQSDSEHGTLFVANDGEPFSRSNFERISALGQSDKDPQKSIGNKGIGFRSVLELTDCPEFIRAKALAVRFWAATALRSDLQRSGLWLNR